MKLKMMSWPKVSSFFCIFPWLIENKFVYLQRNSVCSFKGRVFYLEQDLFIGQQYSINQKQ